MEIMIFLPLRDYDMLIVMKAYCAIIYENVYKCS